MSDEREKVNKKDEEPDVVAHKPLKRAEETPEAETDTPDVVAHKVWHKPLK